MFTYITKPSILLKQIFMQRCQTVRKLSKSNDIIMESVKDKGILTLNRPEVLNVLSLSMLKEIVSILTIWEKQKSLVIIKGAGEKSFCAGGDLKEIFLEMNNIEKRHAYIRNQYYLNNIIKNYKIPYISFMDRITMGVGVGLAVHGKYTVATERTLVAMPETQIGYFPDVGSSYFLPRLEGKLGWYLGLTGYKLKGYDVLKAGIATHYVDSKNLPELQIQLLNCYNVNDIEETLKKFTQTDNAAFSLAPYIKTIDKYFAANSIEEIIENLQEDKSEWAQKTVRQLLKMSPLSLKVTKELFDRGGKSLNECLQMEYRVGKHYVKHGDFIEGIRALLVDKDLAPKWNPSSIQEVSTDLVHKCFEEDLSGLSIDHNWKL